jgi:GTP-binding protein
MTLLDGAAVSYQVVLTKADKITSSARDAVAKKTIGAISKRPAACPEIIVTSADAGIGIEALRATIAKLVAAHGT